jgi:two-component system sensor histidine kinase ChvG
MFERYVSLRGPQPPAIAEAGAGPGPSDDPNQHLGIGLWIVRRNLEAVGGMVWAENRAEGGLSLIVTLPLAA